MEEQFLTDMQTKAAGTHEMFMSYVDAGFTREEALSIVLALLTTVVQVEAMKRRGL